jgi:hypothetical protein
MKGCLVINLEPPYIGFEETDTPENKAGRFRIRRSCPEEIGRILRSQGVSLGQHWPIDDYVAHIPWILTEEELTELQLV